MMKKVVMLLSGGVDSTTLLWWLEHNNYEVVEALNFNYGQKHSKEVECARRIVDYFNKKYGRNVVFRNIDISSLKFLWEKSALISKEMEIPNSKYSEETQKQTIVPNRNMIFVSLAVARAITLGANYVAYAAHKSDYSIYPDCRKEFVLALNTAVYLGNLWTPIEILTPFVDKTKTEIVRIGLSLGVPYELTWSCYKGEERPCLKCGTCLERLEAFYNNNTKDPLLKEEEWEEWRERRGQQSC